MIQVNRIYLIFNRLVTKKFLVDTSDNQSVLKTCPDYSENIVQNRYANFLHISFIMLIFR